MNTLHMLTDLVSASQTHRYLLLFAEFLGGVGFHSECDLWLYPASKRRGQSFLQMHLLHFRFAHLPFHKLHGLPRVHTLLLLLLHTLEERHTSSHASRLNPILKLRLTFSSSMKTARSSLHRSSEFFFSSSFSSAFYKKYWRGTLTVKTGDSYPLLFKRIAHHMILTGFVKVSSNLI